MFIPPDSHDAASQPPPDFHQLARWPELRQHCRASWGSFQRWRIAFFHRLVELHANMPHSQMVESVRSMAPGQSAVINIIGLAEPTVLREQPGDATITLGFFGSRHYLPWLSAFAATAPQRESPPDWFTPPPPPPLPGGGRAPTEIGTPRVTVGSSTYADWFAFTCPDIAASDLIESPLGCPESDERLARQWHSWWEQARTVPEGRQGLDELLMGFAEAHPDFNPMTPWPELRAYCRAAWPTFRDWHPRTRRHVEEAARQATRRITDLHALHPGWSKVAPRRDVIDVVPVSSARVVAQEPGHAVITAGLVGSADFADWVLDFTADPAG
ncbi:hypothetical protein [Nocardiopsis gilva]|nr:hypothetical protein [Nocardiopsis gilva]